MGVISYITSKVTKKKTTNTPEPKATEQYSQPVGPSRPIGYTTQGSPVFPSSISKGNEGYRAPEYFGGSGGSTTPASQGTSRSSGGGSSSAAQQQVYQGPVPQGASEQAFRRTGQTVVTGTQKSSQLQILGGMSILPNQAVLPGQGLFDSDVKRSGTIKDFQPSEFQRKINSGEYKPVIQRDPNASPYSPGTVVYVDREGNVVGREIRTEQASSQQSTGEFISRKVGLDRPYFQVRNSNIIGGFLNIKASYYDAPLSGLTDIGGEANVLQLTGMIPGESFKAISLSRETTLFNKAKTGTIGTRLDLGEKGIDVLYSSKITKPTITDRFFLNIKPTQYLSKITQPYYRIGSNKVLFEGGEGLATSLSGKNLNAAAVNIGGRFKVQETIPRLVSTKNDLSVIKNIPGYEGGIGRVVINVVGKAKGTISTRWNALQGGRETLFQGKMFSSKGKQISNIFGVGKDLEKVNGLSVFGGEAKGVRFGNGKATIYGKIEEAGFIKRLSPNIDSKTFSTGGGTQKTSLNLKSISGYEQGLGTASLRTAISPSNPVGTKFTGGNVMGIKGSQSTSLKTPQMSIQPITKSSVVYEKTYPLIKSDVSYSVSSLQPLSNKQVSYGRTRQVDLSENRFKQVGINSFKLNQSELSKSGIRQLEVSKTKLNERQMFKQMQLSKQLQVSQTRSRTKGIFSNISKVKSKRVGFIGMNFNRKGSRSYSNLFSVQVRRGGVFKTIGSGLSLSKALSVGKTKTSQTLGATFKVVGTKGTIGGLTPRGYYQKTSKKEGVTYIELPKYRLSTPSEKQEIKLAQWNR